MLPDEEVINGNVGKLWLSPVWSQQTQPVLCGNHVVWMDGVLSQIQNIQEVLNFPAGKGVDVLPHHRSFSLVTVWTSPAELTLTTIIASKVTCNTESQL